MAIKGTRGTRCGARFISFSQCGGMNRARATWERILERSAVGVEVRALFFSCPTRAASPPVASATQGSFGVFFLSSLFAETPCAPGSLLGDSNGSLPFLRFRAMSLEGFTTRGAAEAFFSPSNFFLITRNASLGDTSSQATFIQRCHGWWGLGVQGHWQGRVPLETANDRGLVRYDGGSVRVF